LVLSKYSFETIRRIKTSTGAAYLHPTPYNKKQSATLGPTPDLFISEYASIDYSSPSESLDFLVAKAWDPRRGHSESISAKSFFWSSKRPIPKNKLLLVVRMLPGSGKPSFMLLNLQRFNGEALPT